MVMRLKAVAIRALPVAVWAVVTAFASGCDGHGSGSKARSARSDEFERPTTTYGGPAEAITVRVSDELDFGRRDVRNFVLSSSSRRLFVSHADKYDDSLYQWDVDKRKLEHIYHVGAGYFCDVVALSPNGRFAVVGCYPVEVSGPCKTILLDTTVFKVVRDLAIAHRVFEVRFDRDGRQFLVRTTRGDLPGYAFDTTGRRIDRFSTADFAPVEDPKKRLWRVESSKLTSDTHGLYCNDAQGDPHRLTANQWHDNYGVTRDGKYVGATTWDGEFAVWRLADAKEVFRLKMANQYGYLQYDEKKNCFLWGDATFDGTTKLKSIVVSSAVD